jgi:hypothetical protein
MKREPSPPTGVLAERTDQKGHRIIKLRKQDRFALQRQQRAEAAAALFLDLRVARTWKEIAEELGISPATLREITKTPEFDEAYNLLFAELGHDPRYRAAQAGVSDMLPLAVTHLRSMLVDPHTTGATRLRAIEIIFKLNGLDAQQPQQSDRQDLVNFLASHKSEVSQLAIQVPAEFLDAARRFLPSDSVEEVVNATVTVLDEEPTPSV